MLLEAEDAAGVGADALEDAVAVEQAVVVDADLGVGLVVELAADVDLEAHPDGTPAEARVEPTPTASRTARPPRPVASGQGGGPFLDPPLGEPDDPVGLLGDLEVVGDHHHSEPALAVQVAEQLEHPLAGGRRRGSRSARRPGGSPGPPARARAIAARCISPPESSDGRWSSRWPSPTRSSSAVASRADRLPMAPVRPDAVADQLRHHHVLQGRELGQQVVELEDEAERPVPQRVAVAVGPVVDPLAVEPDRRRRRARRAGRGRAGACSCPTRSRRRSPPARRARPPGRPRGAPGPAFFPLR